MPYRIAFLTDIHSNLHGLDAVLREVRAATPDLILVGGDLTFKFGYPRETMELLATIDYQAVKGNTDIYVTDWAAPGAWPHWLPAWGADHARWTRQQLGATHAATIAALPEQRTITVAGAPGGAADLLLTHGVPGNPFIGIHHPPGPANHHPAWALTDDALAGHLRDTRAGLILTGHTHIPLVRRWRDTLIVNPGAVAHIWHPTPDAHLARWALLTYEPATGWTVELRAVPYDTAAAIAGLQLTAPHNPMAAKLITLITPPTKP